MHQELLYGKNTFVAEVTFKANKFVLHILLRNFTIKNCCFEIKFFIERSG